ncbi:MAG TPA: hypothetical protein VIE44_13745 [Methylomirabilota bacterium]|jgi:hypothetical protein
MTGSMPRGVAIVIAVMFAIGLAGPALAQKKLEGIPLVWKPSNKKSSGTMDLAGLADVKVQVDPFVDTRDNKAKIGENQEDQPYKPVTTSGSVADFCTQNFRSIMKLYGITVVPSGGDVVVGGEVLEFMVIETSTYKGEVRLKLTVKKQGKSQWAGLAAGTSTRWGRSYKDENYYETLSDSLLEASTKAIEDQGFRKALGAK